MLHRFAVRLNKGMHDSGVLAPPSVDVIVYALQIVANTVSIVLFASLAGLLTGTLGRTVALLVSFGVIRFITGGYHLKSGALCIVVSSVVMAALPHLYLNEWWTYLLTGASLATVLIFAPSNYDKYARISERHYPKLKWIAAAIVASNFVIHSDIMALAFITQALMLPFKEGGEER